MKKISCKKLKHFIYFINYFTGEIMQDNETIKQGAIFIFGIGFTIFLLGLSAAVFYS
jgi:hypothetical protein